MRNLPWRISFLTIFLYSSLTGCVTTATFEAKEKEASQAWTELKTAQDAIWNLNEELETMKVERDSLERRLKEMGRSLEVANGQIAELERTLSSQRAEIAALSQVSASKDEQLNLLQSTHDRLVTDLKREIEAGEIKISQYKDLLTVNLVDKILFDSGKTHIKSRGKEILKRVGEILNTTNKEIRIEGHTDNVPIGPGLDMGFSGDDEGGAGQSRAPAKERTRIGARYYLESQRGAGIDEGGAG